MSAAPPTRGIDAYRTTAVELATPIERVIMLYDGALRFAADARAATERRDIASRGSAASKLLAVVGELQATLDLGRGGTVAESLNRLYAFVIDCIMESAFTQSVGPLDDAIRILSNLREGWVGLATQTSEN